MQKGLRITDKYRGRYFFWCHHLSIVVIYPLLQGSETYYHDASCFLDSQSGLVLSNVNTYAIQ
jgi:hypothetical protein